MEETGAGTAGPGSRTGTPAGSDHSEGLKPPLKSSSRAVGGGSVRFATAPPPGFPGSGLSSADHQRQTRDKPPSAITGDCQQHPPGSGQSRVPARRLWRRDPSGSFAGLQRTDQTLFYHLKTAERRRWIQGWSGRAEPGQGFLEERPPGTGRPPESERLAINPSYLLGKRQRHAATEKGGKHLPALVSLISQGGGACLRGRILRRTITRIIIS